MLGFAEDFIEVFRVMFYRCFDVVSDVRIKDIIEVFGSYVGIFVINDGYSFSSDFYFVLLISCSVFIYGLIVLPKVMVSMQNVEGIENVNSKWT
jgi:hypothetical protein